MFPTLLLLTWFPLVTIATGGRLFRFTASELEHWFSSPWLASEQDKRALPIWCAATFEGGRRASALVREVTALVLDFDGVSVPLEAVVDMLPVASLGHTSWSHGDKPGHSFRVVVPTDRTMTVREHARLWAWLRVILEGIGAPIDTKTKDPGRAWFVPAARPGYASACALDRDVLDVDEALSLAPGDESTRSPTIARTVAPDSSAFDRARRYLARKDASISGAGGHQALFAAAVDLVRGFALSEPEALELLRCDFNPRCKPPWSERDLARKVREAGKAERVGLGHLLEAKRTA